MTFSISLRNMIRRLTSKLTTLISNKKKNHSSTSNKSSNTTKEKDTVREKWRLPHVVDKQIRPCDNSSIIGGQHRTERLYCETSGGAENRLAFNWFWCTTRPYPKWNTFVTSRRNRSFSTFWTNHSAATSSHSSWQTARPHHHHIIYLCGCGSGVCSDVIDKYIFNLPIKTCQK